jgi:cell division protein FtsN
MSKDFAKQPPRRNTGRRGGSASPGRKRGASKPAGVGAPRWLWFGAGVILGLLLAFLFRLATVPVPEQAAGRQPLAETDGSEPAGESPGEEFTFFHVLRENEVIVEDPPPQQTPEQPDYVYFLQAGSFPAAENADTRRAEIAFLGEEARVEKVVVNGQTRFRVMIGPIESRSRQRSIRSKLLSQGIETLAYKRSRT